MLFLATKAAPQKDIHGNKFILYVAIIFNVDFFTEEHLHF